MNTIVKSALVSATLALGALAGASAAQADVGVGIYLGGHSFGGVGIGIGVNPYHDNHYVYGGHCSKSEALGRAASMGVSKRYVTGVTDSRIVVRGRKNGHPVQVVMRRNTDHCAVKSFAYL